jgi:protein N-terminal asparagine amidohydrolase
LIVIFIFPGSDDATTCIIALIRHSGSGAVSLSHLDGHQVEVCVCQMIAKIQELSIGYPEGRIELQLVGGYRDTQGYGEELFFSIMQAFHKHPLEIDLTQAVVGDLNTVQRGDINWPIIYGIGINIKTGEIFPANFPDKGPDVQLRLARKFTGGHSVLDIYDSQAGMIRIGPFNYEPMRGVDLWLSQTDEFLLQHLSTSPEVEPSHFACQLRGCLKYIQDNQFPSVTVFRDNHPHYFRRDEATGLWQRVPY